MGEDWLDSIKTQLKKNPKLYWTLIEYLSPVKVNRKHNYRMVFPMLAGEKDMVILNLG
jgi:hypothetical protein